MLTTNENSPLRGWQWHSQRIVNLQDSITARDKPRSLSAGRLLALSSLAVELITWCDAECIARPTWLNVFYRMCPRLKINELNMTIDLQEKSG